MSDPIISRIYDLKISGYDDSIAQLQSMTDAFEKMDAAKTKLNAKLQKKTDTGDSATVQQLTAKIKELQIEMDRLTQKSNGIKNEMTAEADATNKSALAYSNLIKSYKEAKTNAQDVAAQFGVNSQQAKEAAASAAEYKAQLDAINTAIKNGGVANPTQQVVNTPPSPVNPSVSKNISELDLLVQKYKEAVAASKELAIQYGFESKEALAAAQSVANYKSQLDRINDFVKSGGSVSVVKQTDISNLTAIRMQITELETALKTGSSDTSQTSTISFQGQNISATEAIEKIKQLKIVEDQLTQSNAIQQQSTDVLTQAQQKLSFSQSDSGKKLAEYNLQTQLSNKSNKEIAQSTLGLIDDYGKLKAEYNEAAAAAKNLSTISLKSGNLDDIQAAEAATAKAKGLHDSLLQIEQGVGQSQRNVGNYTGALQVLQTSLTDAKQKLDSLTQSQRDNTKSGQVLQEEVNLLSQLTGRQSQGFQTLRREVYASTQALAAMEQEAKELNIPPETISGYEDLQKVVSQSRQELNEFNKQQILLSSEVPGISALTAVAKGLGSAYAIGAGATQLFSDGNEKTAEKLNKLVAVMTLLQGLTELNTTLQERSAIATALSTLKEQALTGFLILKNFVLTGSLSAIKADTAAKTANTVATEGLSVAEKAAAASGIALRTVLIATGIGALLILLTASALAMSRLAENTEVAKEKIAVLNEVNTKAIESFTEQKIKVDDLVLALNNSNASLETKKDKLNELIALNPAYLNGLTLQNLNTEEGRKILDQYNISLQRKAELEAAQSSQVDAAKGVAQLNVVKQEIEDAIKGGAKIGFNDFSKEASEYINTYKTSAGRLSLTNSIFDLNVSKSDLQQALSDVEKDIDKAQNKVTASNEVFKTKLNSSLQSGDAPKSYEDEVKQIETIRDKALSVENTTVAETERIRALSLDEEKQHLLTVEKINVDALNQKIALIQKNKTLNDEQQKDLASFEEQRANIQLDTSKKIQDLNKKGDRSSSLDEFRKKDLETISKYSQNEIEILKNKFKQELDDQNASQDERIKALKNYFLLSAQAIANNKKNQEDALQLETDTAVKNADRIKNAQTRADTLVSIEKYRVDKLKTIQQESGTAAITLDQQIFSERETILKDNLAKQIDEAKAANKQIQDNPDSTPTEKAKGQVNEDNAVIRAQISFFLEMEGLQNVFNEKSKTNWEKFNQDIKNGQTALNKDTKAAAASILADFDKITNDDITAIKLKYDKLIAAILASKKSISDKNAAIKIVNNSQDIEVNSAQLKGDVLKAATASTLLTWGAITKEQFEAIYAAANSGQQKLNTAIEAGKDNITSFSQFLNISLSKLLDFGEGSGDAQLLANTLSGAFNTAKDAMNDYFSSESANIQHSNQITQQRLNIELQQAQARSQSQAESDSLARQYQAKEDAANEAAFEKNKKLQIEQAKINLAIQLSNLAVIAFAPNPLNIATLGVAGTIMYAIQAALAVATYALNVNKINSAQYAEGGKVEAARVGNGRITTMPNITTQTNGDNIYATVKTNEVILNESQQKKLGGAATFKAIGVPGFGGGGKAGVTGNSSFSSIYNYATYAGIRGYADGGFTGIGGNIGANWDMAQAPVNPQSYLNPGKNNVTDSKDIFSAIDQLTQNISAAQRQTNQRIDKLQVVLDPNAVAKANNKTMKAAAIGKL